jgi:uncharacterized protein (UPF0305 family)
MISFGIIKILSSSADSVISLGEKLGKEALYLHPYYSYAVDDDFSKCFFNSKTDIKKDEVIPFFFHSDNQELTFSKYYRKFMLKLDNESTLSTTKVFLK